MKKFNFFSSQGKSETFFGLFGPTFRSLFLINLLLLMACSGQKQQAKQIFNDAETQTRLMLNEITEAKGKWGDRRGTPVSPRTLDKEGNLVLVPSRDWTSGFFPGLLWYLYEFTGNQEWVSIAREYTLNIEPEKLNRTTHDMGFKIYCSFGNGYRLAGDGHYRDVIIESARTLATRFNPVAGCIRSWDHNRDKWDYPVIIDNMMNLELMFMATRMTDDSTYYKMAISHANTTMKNHFREDFSSYHVIDYDTITGAVRKRNTHQGHSHESSWSRGQAWALYGYTMCFRETGKPEYLKQAEHIASFILSHPRLPDDLVPYWDFDAPAIPNEPRDVSAASIIASALYELSTYSENKKLYVKKADQIIGNLTANYRPENGQARGFLLLHSTGSKAHNSEVDVPLNYADYYYLEAVIRSEKLRETGKL